MNKRHYEHTLPNIRGSLSNTYECRDIFIDYRNIDRISLANSRLLSLGKSETGSLYFDL